LTENGYENLTRTIWVSCFPLFSKKAGQVVTLFAPDSYREYRDTAPVTATNLLHDSKKYAPAFAWLLLGRLAP
jgi:hypothetical protein